MADFKKLKDGQGNSYNVKDETARTNLSSHTSNTSNPHSVTKSQVGLGNCDNTSDLNKPVSTATQTALGLKIDKSAIKTSTPETPTDNDVPSIKYLEDTFAKINNYYESLGVGYASQADHANSAQSLDTEVGNDDQTPFNYNTVGINSDVETGIQTLRKLVGVDIVKNQLLSLHTIAETTDSNITYRVQNQKVYIDGTSNATGSRYVNVGEKQSNVFTADHIYLILILVTKGIVNFNASSLYQKPYIIVSAPYKEISTPFAFFTATENNYMYARIGIGEGAVYNNAEIEYKYVDLTQRYGSNNVVNVILGNGTDTEKYAKLITFDPNILNDLSADTGSLIPSQSKYLKTVDYNQWDEEWEQGAFNTETGANLSVNNQIRSKNLISVIGNHKYAAITSVDNADIWAMFYDAQGNVISLGATGTQNNVNNVMRLTNLEPTYKIPINAVKMKFYVTIQYGGTYRNDISIFLYWDGSRIGYEEYNQHIIELPNKVQHGILKVVDGKVVADGDELYPDGSGVQKRAITNLNSLSWSYWDAQSCWKTSSLNSVIPNNTNDKVFDGICDTFEMTTWNNKHDGSIFTYYDGNTKLLCAKNGSSTVEPTGTLSYKLASPVDLTDQGTFPESFYGDDFGTMSFLDADSNVIAGLQGCEIFYKANISGFAESLYVKTDGDPDDIVVQSDLSDYEKLTEITGYDATKTQVLKNVEGVLQWVDEE